MRFVITGATSFLGCELCHYLINNGEEVYAVIRRESNKEDHLPSARGLHVIRAEMKDYDKLWQLIEDVDIFINLAWEGTGHLGRNQVEVQQKNIADSFNAMMSAYRMGCRLFVESGSQAEYGTVIGKITENTPCNPFSEYGKAKLETMKQGFLFAKQTGMKYLHLRIFSLFGENDHPWTLVMSCIDKMLLNDPIDLSPCTQNWNFLYVKDAVRQIVGLCNYAVNSPEFQHEIFNIASKDTRVLMDFVKDMYSLTNSKSELNFGAIIPTNIVSLDPDTTKTENAAGFISDYTFKDVINIIIAHFNSNNYDKSI